MVAAIAGVAAVAGAAISADAAGSAADQQSESAQAASMQQQMAAAQMRQDLSPWTQSGSAAQSRLNQYLGIGGAGASGRTSMGLSTGLTPTQVREQLLGRYTRAGAAGAAPATPAGLDPSQPGFDRNAFVMNRNAQPAAPQQIGYTGSGATNQGTEGGVMTPVYGTGQQQGPGSTIDEAGLQSAMDQYYREQEAANAQAQSDPNYGSLLRAYRGGQEFDSGPAFSFTGKDVATDPGYQFGLQQGQQGIDRAQAARGNYLSGAAVKEASRFNSDYAGTKFNEGFNRASSTYGTNLARRQNEWNTNLGAYDNNRNSIYSYLTGASTLGQNSAARVGASNQMASTQIGNNLMAAGAAQSAGTIAGGNAMVGGINQVANSYNQINNPNSAAGWNSLLSRGGGGYSGYTGYVGGGDAIGDMNTNRGWT